MARVAVLGGVVAVGTAGELVEGFERLDERIVHPAGGLDGHEVHDTALAEGVAVVALLLMHAPLARLPVEGVIVRRATSFEAVHSDVEVLECVAVREEMSICRGGGATAASGAVPERRLWLVARVAFELPDLVRRANAVDVGDVVLVDVRDPARAPPWPFSCPPECCRLGRRGGWRR